MTPDLKTKPVVNYPLTLTTLTPVCVKSHDEPLSPLADYVQDGEQIHFIDQQKFLQKLSVRELVDAYAKMVTKVNVQQQGKHDVFKQFLAENEIRVDDIKSVSRTYLGKGNPTQISRHIHSAGRVYIPGSTLKGMIRFALFLNFYKDPKIKDEVIRRAKDHPFYYDSFKGIKEAENFFVTKNRGFLYNNASLWGFEDSEFVDSDRISIIQLNRKRLVYKEEEKDLESLSVLQEVIAPDVTINLNLFVKNTALDRITKGEIENFYNQSSIQPNTLFKALNQASKAFIEFQKKHINHDDTELYKTQVEYLECLVSKFSIDNQWALVCLGFGKSMLQNSIALSVQNNWNRLRINAPTTFFTEANTGETIGWCVIGKERYTEECKLHQEEEIQSQPVVKAPRQFELTDVSTCRQGDSVIVQITNIRQSTPKVIARYLLNGTEQNMEITGTKKVEIKIGDWLEVSLKPKSSSGEFKQAGFIELL